MEENGHLSSHEDTFEDPSFNNQVNTAAFTKEKQTETAETQEETVEDLLKELNSMVGLAGVKREVQNRVNRLRILQTAQQLGSKRVFHSGTLHMIFAGNPGTGKTTVARLVGKIYEALGIIEDSSIFVECSRADLIGKYIAQTAPLVQKKVQSALGGILFIDEAYSLYQEGIGNDFGDEAISELVRQMENNRDRLIVILAGYSKDMKNMIDNANPGLKSRFPIWLDFEDYSKEELVQIFVSMLK